MQWWWGVGGGVMSVSYDVYILAVCMLKGCK